jgi:hypothetical protein
MPWNKRILMLVLGAAIAAACTTGCKKSSEAEKVARDRSTAREEGSPGKEAVEEPNAYLAAVRREQLELRARLHAEIDEIDRALLALKLDAERGQPGRPIAGTATKETKKIRELLDRRKLLEDDLHRVNMSDERGWDELKSDVERNLSAKPSGPPKT